MSGSFMSSAVCRAQEAYHRDRATAETLLANVRAISAKAAAAWAHEATMAEQREAKSEQRRKLAGATLLADRTAVPDCDRWFSENPDRGFTHSPVPPKG